MSRFALLLTLLLAGLIASSALADGKPKKLESVGKLIQYLEQPSKAGAAVNDLVKHGKGAVGALIGALNHKSPLVQKHALTALSRIGPPASKASTAVLRLALAGGPQYQAAMSALDKFGPAAIPAMTKKLKHKSVDVRLQLIKKIGAHRDKAGAGVRGLIGALKDKEYRVRVVACKALGDIGGKVASSAVVALGARLKDKHKFVKDAAHRALTQMKRTASESTKKKIDKFLEPKKK